MEVKKEFRPEREDIVSFWENGVKIEESTKEIVGCEIKYQKQQLDFDITQIQISLEELNESILKIEPQKLLISESEKELTAIESIKIPLFFGKEKQAEKDKLFDECNKKIETQKSELLLIENEIENNKAQLQSSTNQAEYQKTLISRSELKLQLIEHL